MNVFSLTMCLACCSMRARSQDDSRNGMRARAKRNAHLSTRLYLDWHIRSEEKPTINRDFVRYLHFRVFGVQPTYMGSILVCVLWCE